MRRTIAVLLVATWVLVGHAAQKKGLKPGIKRASARTVTFPATDYIDGFKLLRGLIALAAAQ